MIQQNYQAQESPQKFAQMELVQEDSAESESDEVKSQSIREIKFGEAKKNAFNPNNSEEDEDKNQSDY